MTEINVKYLDGGNLLCDQDKKEFEMDFKAALEAEMAEFRSIQGDNVFDHVKCLTGLLKFEIYNAVNDNYISIDVQDESGQDWPSIDMIGWDKV